MNRARRIAILTGARAEYGLLQGLMQRIDDDANLELQCIVTGSHLSNAHGLTVREIEEDGFAIAKRVEMLLSSDTSVGVAKSMAVAQMGMADCLADLQPDLLVVLGDRYEILPAVSSALVFRIPVAHIHGGELSQGAIDDAVRHAITKLSHLHFVATAEYGRRVVQMGEEPSRVYNVGALGVDNVAGIVPTARADVERELGLRLGPRNVLVTFHPVTLDERDGAEQLREVLAGLLSVDSVGIILTLPNADTGNHALATLARDFAAKNSGRAWVFPSLGFRRYLSLMRHVDAVVGNSSSGIIEAPALRVPTLNIGDRQQGRSCAESIVHCQAERHEVAAALRTAFSEAHRSKTAHCRLPYGGGGAAERIHRVLAEVSLAGLTRKRFRDSPDRGST